MEDFNSPTLNENPSGTAGSKQSVSFWTEQVKMPSFNPLQENLSCDVAIAGAGLAGLTAAYILAKEGKKVIVLEERQIGSGETGRTTAHLSNALDDRYHWLAQIHGRDGARLAASSHTAAIDFIEQTVEKEKMDAGFQRLDGYLFLHPSDRPESLSEELKASRDAGLETELLPAVPGISFEQGAALHFPHQAQFHPLKYLSGLSEAIVKLGGQIFAETRVDYFGEDELRSGKYHVSAKQVLVATNAPSSNVFELHTKQFPYRSYVIGARIKKSAIQPALWWDSGDQNAPGGNEPYNYVRTQMLDEDHYLLIAGGADHKTGQASEEQIPEQDRYRNLETWLRERFPLAGEILYRWSGQVLEPLDGLAHIGRNKGKQHQYVITGDSGNGMTHATLGAMLVADMILGRNNPWEKLYDPSRITLQVAGDFLKEGANMASQYLDYVRPGDYPSDSEIDPGQGGVIKHGLGKRAVYRDEAGELHEFSAVCPHLGCIVHWNQAELSFDCPCHGSRFSEKGKLLSGPAVSDLKRIH